MENVQVKPAYPNIRAIAKSVKMLWLSILLTANAGICLLGVLFFSNLGFISGITHLFFALSATMCVGAWLVYIFADGLGARLMGAAQLGYSCAMAIAVIIGLFFGVLFVIELVGDSRSWTTVLGYIAEILVAAAFLTFMVIYRLQAMSILKSSAAGLDANDRVQRSAQTLKNFSSKASVLLVLFAAYIYIMYKSAIVEILAVETLAGFDLTIFYSPGALGLTALLYVCVSLASYILVTLLARDYTLCYNMPRERNRKGGIPRLRARIWKETSGGFPTRS